MGASKLNSTDERWKRVEPADEDVEVTWTILIKKNVQRYLQNFSLKFHRDMKATGKMEQSMYVENKRPHDDDYDDDVDDGTTMTTIIHKPIKVMDVVYTRR